IRSQSVAYDATLSWKYPVNERYTLTGSYGWSLLEYQNNAALAGLTTYTAGVDLFYAFSTERDLFAGYRIRVGDTTANVKNVDHNFSLGVSGKVLPRVNGSLRVGYQFRKSDAVAPAAASNFQSISAAGTLAYGINKKTTLSGQLSKD